MPEDGSKFKYREAVIVALIGALIPAVFSYLKLESKSTPASSAHSTPTPAETAAPTPLSPGSQSTGSAAEPMPKAARETPQPTSRPEYIVQPTATPFYVDATPPGRLDMPPPRYAERRSQPPRVPEVKTRAFSHEPTRNPRYKAADDLMNRLFKQAMARMDETERWNFTMEQRSWLNERTALWEQRGDNGVIDLTEQRNRELRQRFGL